MRRQEEEAKMKKEADEKQERERREAEEAATRKQRQEEWVGYCVQYSLDKKNGYSIHFQGARGNH